MSQEPFCVETYKKNAGPQAHKSHFVWTLTGKVPDPDPRAHVLYWNLQEKTHMDISEDAFCVEIYTKNVVHGFRDPHVVLKSTAKNAHGHCTRAILSRNLEEKCQTPGEHLD